MKIYRLLGIIIYLLNHEKANCKQLAEKFEVSPRTIQRDMDTLLMADIPIVTATGIYGGYAIEANYKLANQFVKKEDFDLIIRALKSYTTRYDNKNLDTLLEKYLTLSKSPSFQPVYFDYSVTKENKDIQEKNKKIEASILNHYQLWFEYNNINNFHSNKKVIPLVLRFQWYAWYLFAFDIDKADYRTYKVARMQNIDITNIHFEPYDTKLIEAILKERDQQYLDTCTKIEIWCHQESLHVVEEYFPIEEVQPQSDGHFLLYFYVPTHERLWQALLLRMGNQIKVIAPHSYRDELKQIAQNFLSNYDR